MILMKNIIKEGHPTLTKKAAEVSLPLSKNDKNLLLDMLDFIKNSQDEETAEKYDLRPAVGIAAPQLNIDKRIFAVYLHDFDGILYEYALINPVVTVTDNSLIYLPGGEGCLSVDRETTGITPRYKAINIKAHTYDAYADIVVPIELDLDGYIGIVFQHEFDHLEGILFTQKMFDEIPNAKPAFEIAKEEASDQV